MSKEKRYVIPESRLLDLLVAEMTCAMNERDGVDNWGWYGSSYEDVIKEYWPGDEPMTEDEEDSIDMWGCARARLEAGEFQEEINLGEFVLAYDLASGEDIAEEYGYNPGYYDDL